MNDDDDKVGYGRPPKARRFKPGRSGNPAGRAKKTRSASEAFDRISRKKITTADGRKVLVTEAIVISQAQKALKGDTRAAQLVLGGVAEHEAQNADAAPELTREDREIYARAIERLSKLGDYE